MRFLDFLTSTRRPLPETPVLSASQVRERILAINRPTAPYVVRDGAPEGADLVAEWKILDEEWSDTFYRAGMRQGFRIHMRLDPPRASVRAVDYMREISWSAEFPRAQISGSWARGQFNEISSGAEYVFVETLTPKLVHRYQFSTFDIKTRVQEAVTGCGWTYRGIVFGRL